MGIIYAGVHAGFGFFVVFSGAECIYIYPFSLFLNCVLNSAVGLAILHYTVIGAKVLISATCPTLITRPLIKEESHKTVSLGGETSDHDILV